MVSLSYYHMAAWWSCCHGRSCLFYSAITLGFFVKINKNDFPWHFVQIFIDDFFISRRSYDDKSPDYNPFTFKTCYRQANMSFRITERHASSRPSTQWCSSRFLYTKSHNHYRHSNIKEPQTNHELPSWDYVLERGIFTSDQKAKIINWVCGSLNQVITDGEQKGRWRQNWRTCKLITSLRVPLLGLGS